MTQAAGVLACNFARALDEERILRKKEDANRDLLLLERLDDLIGEFAVQQHDLGGVAVDRIQCLHHRFGAGHHEQAG